MDVPHTCFGRTPLHLFLTATVHLNGVVMMSLNSMLCDSVYRMGRTIHPASRLAFARNHLVQACFSTESPLEARIRAFYLLLEWAIDDICTANSPNTQSWIHFTKTLCVGAPDLFQHLTPRHICNSPILKSVRMWSHPTDTIQMKQVKQAACAAHQNIVRWVSKSPGWIPTPPQTKKDCVCELYDSMEAFYMAMQLSLCTIDGNRGHRTELAHFLLWAFPFAVIAPTLSQIICPAAREHVHSRIIESVHEFKKYVVPIGIACASILSWITMPLPPMCVETKCSNSTWKDDLEPLLIALACKGSLFWRDARNARFRQVVRRYLTSGRARRHMRHTLIREKSESSDQTVHVDDTNEWRQYVWAKAYARMSRDDSHGSCEGTLLALRCPKMWGMYKMFVQEIYAEEEQEQNGDHQEKSTSAHSIIANTIHGTDAILIASSAWPRKTHTDAIRNAYAWSSTYNAQLMYLARQLSALWKQRVGALTYLNTRFQLNDMVYIIASYLVQKEGTTTNTIFHPYTSLYSLVRQSVIVLKSLAYNGMDDIFSHSYKNILKCVSQYRTSSPAQLQCLGISRQELLAIQSQIPDALLVKTIAL